MEVEILLQKWIILDRHFSKFHKVHGQLKMILPGCLHGKIHLKNVLFSLFFFLLMEICLKDCQRIFPVAPISKMIHSPNLQLLIYNRYLHQECYVFAALEEEKYWSIISDRFCTGLKR